MACHLNKKERGFCLQGQGCGKVLNLIHFVCVCFRNNLTIMDTVVVTGQGCHGEMKFSNRKPGSPSPLTFEMTEKHLKNCDS